MKKSKRKQKNIIGSANGKRNQAQISYGKEKMNLLDQGLKVIINPIAAEGIGKLLWPELLRKMNIYFHYFDYEFTETKGHATNITQKAISEGFSTILAIGGKGTLKEVIRGFFNIRGSLLRSDIKLVYLPLTFGRSGATIPDRVENWYFSISLDQKNGFYLRPFFFQLIGKNGNKIRGSKFIFLHQFKLFAETKSTTISIQMDNEKQIKIASTYLEIVRPMLQNKFSKKMELTLFHKSFHKKNWQDYSLKEIWRLLFLQKIDSRHWVSELEIISDNELILSIDNDKYNAYGIVIYPAREQIYCNAMDIL